MVKSEAIDTAKPSGVTSSQTALRGHRPLAYRALQYDNMTKMTLTELQTERISTGNLCPSHLILL